MFGLKAPVAGEPSAPPPAAPAAKPVATTAMFGAVQATGPIPQASTKAPNSTMMFGKPPPEAAAPPEANLNKTMAFGMPALPPPPSSVGRSTMIFGAADASKPPMPKVTPGGAPVAQITESTVRVDLDAMMRERGQAGEAEASPDRHNRTQLFAMNEARGGEKTPPEAFASPLAGEANLNTGSVGQAPGVRHERTQLFSMTPGSKPAGNVPASREFSNDVTLPPDGAMRTTMMFGATNNADTAPGLPGVTPELLRQPISSDGATTGPNLVPLIVKDLRSSPLERSFETTDTDSPIRSSDSSQDLAPHAEDSLEGNEQAFAAIESSTRRRNTIAVIVLLVAVLAAGSAVAWQFYLRPMLGGETPTKVMVPKGEKPEKAEKVEKTEKPAKE